VKVTHTQEWKSEKSAGVGMTTQRTTLSDQPLPATNPALAMSLNYAEEVGD